MLAMRLAASWRAEATVEGQLALHDRGDGPLDPLLAARYLEHAGHAEPWRIQADTKEQSHVANLARQDTSHASQQISRHHATLQT